MLKKRAVYAVFLVFLALGLVACGGGGSAPTLEPPSNLRATPDAGFIKLSWQDNSDNETGFVIYREESTGGAGQNLDEIGEVEANVESFEDGEVEVEKTYRYAVAAKNAASVTDPVLQSGSAVSPEPPIDNNAPVVDFRASPDEGTPPLKVFLSWSISDSDADDLSCEIDIGDDGSTEYEIEKCISGEQEHVFESAGSFTVALSVSDGKDVTKKTTVVNVVASLQSSSQ